MNQITRRSFQTNAGGFADLFLINPTTQQSCAEELRDTWEHLLSVPWGSAVNQLPSQQAAPLRKLAGILAMHNFPEQSHSSCLAQLLQNANPPSDGLMFAKEFGKAIHGSDNEIAPKVMGWVVYCASYAAGLVHGGRKIGQAKDNELREWFGTARELTWLDAATRMLLDQALQILSDR